MTLEQITFRLIKTRRLNIPYDVRLASVRREEWERYLQLRHYDELIDHFRPYPKNTVQG